MTYFPPKTFNAIDYSEYIVTRLEMLSIFVIAATVYLFFMAKVGILLSAVPSVAFHAFAYWNYRRFVRSDCTHCLDAKKVACIDTSGWAAPSTIDCPRCQLGK